MLITYHSTRYQLCGIRASRGHAVHSILVTNRVMDEAGVIHRYTADGVRQVRTMIRRQCRDNGHRLQAATLGPLVQMSFDPASQAYARAAPHALFSLPRTVPDCCCNHRR